ncbi:phage major tail tube protein [Azospirillum sp.]|uniref:phage major tail tube protein n=1 Tax=Azospirillum sp. TaxID=34012 RepID=UPI002D6EEE3A|nr:phage major tail tube protein [Azospirillum sp.]HYD66995.1 phage major tail tube protein [Azospirillum sp.]
MAIQLPRVLKNLNLFMDGIGYAGRVDEVTLPKLSIKAVEHRAGGMDLPVQLDMGLTAMEIAMVLSDFEPEVFRSFGLLDSAGTPITVRGAFQAQGSADVLAVSIAMRGGWKTLDAGKWKPGEKSILTVTGALSYYKLMVGSETLVEIDAVNMVRIIDGVDQMKAMRDAIGLNSGFISFP